MQPASTKVALLHSASSLLGLLRSRVCSEMLPMLVTSKTKIKSASQEVYRCSKPIFKLIPFPGCLKKLMDLRGSE